MMAKANKFVNPNITIYCNELQYIVMIIRKDMLDINTCICIHEIICY